MLWACGNYGRLCLGQFSMRGSHFRWVLLASSRKSANAAGALAIAVLLRSLLTCSPENFDWREAAREVREEDSGECDAPSEALELARLRRDDFPP